MSATPSGQIVEVPLPLEALLSQLNTVNLVMLYIFREYLAKICSNLPRHATSAPVSNLLGFGEFLSDNIFYARLLVLLKVEITVTKEELASSVMCYKAALHSDPWRRPLLEKTFFFICC